MNSVSVSVVTTQMCTNKNFRKEFVTLTSPKAQNEFGIATINKSSDIFIDDISTKTAEENIWTQERRSIKIWEKSNAYTILVGKPVGKCTPVRRKSRWEDNNITIVLSEIFREKRKRIKLAQDQDV
jgi:hypothetical protein